MRSEDLYGLFCRIGDLSNSDDSAVSELRRIFFTGGDNDPDALSLRV